MPPPSDLRARVRRFAAFLLWAASRRVSSRMASAYPDFEGAGDDASLPPEPLEEDEDEFRIGGGE